MGIRFACHHCNFSLHVKDFQGGKRGRCPECSRPFRIPLADSQYSLQLDEEEQSSTSSNDGMKEKSVYAGTPLSHDGSNYDGTELNELPVKPAGTRAVGKPSVEQIVVKEIVAKDESVFSKMPSALADFPGANWFVRPPTGGQFGPAGSQLLMDWIAERRVTGESLLWREGSPNWQLASLILPDLFPNSVSMPEVPAASKGSSHLLFGSGVADMGEEVKPSVFQDALAKKRSKKRKQQLSIVLVLGGLSIALLATLIVVLIVQMSKSS